MNKYKTTLIEVFLNEISEYINTIEIPDELIKKFIELERSNIECIESEAKEIVIIRQFEHKLTNNKNTKVDDFSEECKTYSDGYKEGYQRALQLVKLKIDLDLK